ncbi:MAG: glycosyltransferase, partial [Rubripirellula sp.]
GQQGNRATGQQGNRATPTLSVDDESLTVLVPCFNESATVGALLQRVRDALPRCQIIVVDDASTDDSADIIADLAQRLDLETVYRKSNGGKGSAVRSGLELAKADWVVIQDADLEYDPADLARMLQQIKSRNDVVYGSRYLNSGKASGGLYAAYWAVQLLGCVQWLLFGRWLSDPLTCYKMLPTDLARKLQLDSRGFELCTEINAKLLRAGRAIQEVPISYQPRSYAEGKKIVAADFVRLVATMIRFRIFDRSNAVVIHRESETSPRSNWLYIAIRLAIGTLLFVAGLSKVAAAQPMLLGSSWIIPAGLVVAWGVIEMVTGWAALTLVPHRPLRRWITALFMLFLAVLTVNWYAGATRCQCLGVVNSSIIGMIVVDAFVIASLFVFRRRWDSEVHSPSGMMGEVAQNMKLAIPILLIGATLWFGSPSSSVNYLSGKSLLVDSAEKFIGSVESNEKATVAFRIRNRSSSPIRILGAEATCRCLAIQDLPVTIEPFATKAIHLSLFGAGRRGRQRESAKLICDDSASELTLNVTALVHSNPHAVDATFLLGEN